MEGSWFGIVHIITMAMAKFPALFFPIRMFQIFGRVISHDLNAEPFPYRRGGFKISGSLFRGTRIVNVLLRS